MHPRAILFTVVLATSALAQGTISSVVPASVPAGSAGFTLTVNGSGFASANLVQWDGANLATTFVSSTQLTAPVSAPLVASAATHAVRVKQSALINNFSNTFHFTVTNPAPTLASIAPNAATVGAASFVLTANGANFNSSSVIRWNGTPLATTFGSTTSLTANVGASLVAAAGTASVTVNNPSPGGGTSGSRTFTVNNPVPALTALSPSPLVVNPLFDATITAVGSNFGASTTILLDGNPVTTTFIGPTQVSFTLTVAQLASPVVYAIAVRNPTPGGGTTAPMSLPVVYPAPQVTGVAPAVVAGGSPSAGLPVAIDSFSPTQIGVTIPGSLLNATDVIPIRVNTAAPGGGQGAGGLIVTGPAITGVTPAVTNVLAPGSLVSTLTVNGTGFAAGDVIRFNGVARPTAFVSSSALTSTIDGTLPVMQQLGGFGVTVMRPGLVSNAFAVRVGTSASPDNVGTITLAPAPPAPGQLFDLRIELPVGTGVQLPSVPLTIVVDTAAPAPFIFTPVLGFDLSVSAGFGAPFTIVDGLGLFGPADGTGTALQDLSFFGVSGFRRFFRTLPITAPPPLGVTVSLVAVWSDPSSPIGLDATYISGPYTF